MRRNDIEQMVPAELAIRGAMLEVESMDADERLTSAVVLLQQAQAKVADYIDRKEIGVRKVIASVSFEIKASDNDAQEQIENKILSSSGDVELLAWHWA